MHFFITHCQCSVIHITVTYYTVILPQYFSILTTLSIPYFIIFHLTILIYDLNNPNLLSIFIGQVSLPCRILLLTQQLYTLSWKKSVKMSFHAIKRSHLQLFEPPQSLAVIAASLPSTLNISQTAEPVNHFSTWVTWLTIPSLHQPCGSLGVHKWTALNCKHRQIIHIF